MSKNKINNAVYNKSITIDLINKANDLNFLESGKTNLVEVMVVKSLTKKAFGFS